MRFSAPAGDLAAALSLAAGAVPKKITVPILNSILIEAGAGGWARLRGTDLDMDAAAQCEASVIDPGAVAIDARMADVIGTFPDDAPVTISDDGSTVCVVSGRSRFKPAAMPALDFPASLSLEGAPCCEFSLSDEDTHRIFGRLSFAMSAEISRHYLAGIYIHLNDGKLIGVTTDGHTLASTTIDAPELTGSWPSRDIVVPRRACRARR
jgi:DNA polymerase-3 subunit beta